MIRKLLLLLGCLAASSFGAQGSGLFIDAHASQGKMKGNKLVHLENNRIGVIVGDSVRYPGADKDLMKYYNITSIYPVDFQYSVKYSFLIGYEKSFSKVLSLRGAVGYQNVLLDANAGLIPGFQNGDMTEVPVVSAEIDRHWISIPVDFKVMLPIRRSGLYLAVGPKASILLSSTYRDSLTSIKNDMADKTPRFNFGIGFRFGAELAIAHAGYLLLESGYHKGLVNLSHISKSKTFEGEIVPIGIGFRFNVPSKKM